MINGKRVAVVLPAFNAARTLAQTVGELPDLVDIRILVDDGSADETVQLARTLGLTVFTHDRNYGYGRNQMTCYREALEAGADVVVMLHPDYQYTPKLLTAIASLIAHDVYDVVLGSRILGDTARQGGMPLYKYIANRLLTAGQNLLLGAKLSEYHTGYRGFSRRALESLPLLENSDDFVFDNQVLTQAVYFGLRIGEVSCPTKYFPEASSINFRRSVRYGFGVVATALQCVAARQGLARFSIFNPDGRRLGATPPLEAPRCHATNQRWLEAAFCTMAALLGAAQAWAARHQPSSVDGVSYLDIADAYFQGRWKDAINAYWNPLYSWILGLSRAVLRPAPAFEYEEVTLVDYILFLFCIASFSWFLRQLRATYRARTIAEGAQAGRVSDWTWVVVGYTLFIWSSIKWIALTSSTPDMVAAALCYLIWGLMLRMERHGNRHDHVWLGVALALAYFARTPMFVVGCTIVLLLALRGGQWRHGFVTAVVFVSLTVPFISAISLAKHHFTVGDNGKLNHAWLANPGRYKIPDTHWQGGPPGYGVPRHPTRQISDLPPAFEFSRPIGGTFPPWTDPSYWNDGLTYHFDASAEWRTISDNFKFYGRMFLGWMIVILAAALAVAGDVRATARAIRRQAVFWIPAAVALGLYAVANDLSVQRLPAQPPTRYMAVFIVIGSLSLLGSLRFLATERIRMPNGGLAATTVGACAVILMMTISSAAATVTEARTAPPRQIAQLLHEAGIQKGMRIAIIGNKAEHEYWARLARVRIIAQMEDARGFYFKSPAGQDLVLHAFAEAGADAVVTSRISPFLSDPAWHRAGQSAYAVVVFVDHRRHDT